jgi:DNA-binding MarR family transcriptional regulator
MPVDHDTWIGTDDERWIPAWLDLVRTYTGLWDRIESDMRRRNGLTMARYDVLAHLRMAGGSLGLTELASAIVLSPSGLSKLLDRMEASGLIRREPDPDDARAAYAKITSRGLEQVEMARAHHHDFVREAFARSLTRRDLADLTRIMGRIEASSG